MSPLEAVVHAALLVLLVILIVNEWQNRKQRWITITEDGPKTITLRSNIWRDIPC